jgi:branched-chain amino acid aminotransferase
MAKWVFLQNGFTEEEKASLSFKDLSFQRAYGIFDFFRLLGNQPLFLEDHLDRFFFSAENMHLPVPLNREEIKTAITELIKKNNQPNSGIRLSLTGGNAEDGFNISNPEFLLSQHSFTPPSDEQVQKGIRLISYPFQRQLPHVKTIDYLMAIWLQPERIAAGADDILYHQDGLISESPRSNFFLVTADDKIVTPARNVLAGITRKKVLQLAEAHVAVEERDVTMEEIKQAKEAFLTSTTKQILPVAQIDETVFPQKKVSHHLLQLFRSSFVRLEST